MGIFKKIKSFFMGTQYRINREILIDYINSKIKFAQDEQLSFCDEFYIQKDAASDELHIVIINNDAPCDSPLKSEKDLTGIYIYLTQPKKSYNPETDKHYFTAEEFVSSELSDYPEWFILRNDLGQPLELEKYKISQE